MDLPVTVAQWREYLRGYSAEALASDDMRFLVKEGTAKWLMTEDQRAEGWLGYEPAAEEEVLAAERRLGVRLPEAYRNFLLTSNGWSCMGLGQDCQGVDLLRADQIGWFAEIEGDLLDAWSEPGMEFFEEEMRMLKRCLLISHDDGGAGCHWLLHVDGAGPDGELIAYEWFPGDGSDPEPWANFAALVTRTEDADS